MKKLLILITPIIFLVGCKVEDSQPIVPKPPIVIDILPPPVIIPDEPIVPDQPIIPDKPIIADSVPATSFYATVQSIPTVYILADFTNSKFTDFPEDTDSSYNKRLFGYNVGQVNNYWRENFEHKFSQKAASETYGAPNDGIIRVSVDLAHPGVALDRTTWTPVLEAIMKKADAFINLLQFDTNKDGFLSSTELSINFIIAGYDAAVDSSHLSTSIWPHSWCNTYTGTHDNVGVFNCGVNGKYTILAQREADHPTEIGVIVHELGHSIFALPDLYDTDGSTAGLGFLSLMSSGSWGGLSGGYPGSKPVLMDAWCKVKLGHSVTNVYKTDSFKTIPSGVVGNNIFRVISPNDNRISYLLEQKVNTGYDAGYNWVSPGFLGGILSLRIDAFAWTNSWDGLEMVKAVEVSSSPSYNDLYFLNSNGGSTSMNNERSIEFPGIISGVITNSADGSFSYTPR